MVERLLLGMAKPTGGRPTKKEHPPPGRHSVVDDLKHVVPQRGSQRNHKSRDIRNNPTHQGTGVGIIPPLAPSNFPNKRLDGGVILFLQGFEELSLWSTWRRGAATDMLKLAGSYFSMNTHITRGHVKRDNVLYPSLLIEEGSHIRPEDVPEGPSKPH